MIVQWSGRGADGGRDLFFIEQQQGALAQRTIKWLVSCKDRSVSGSSIREAEVGNIVDKLTQHRCRGFLLATSTTASTGLKERLDQLDVSSGGTFHTKVWDRFEISRYLAEDRFAALRKQFFPLQTARANMTTIDAAREIIEASLPRVASGSIRRHLVPYNERFAQLDGARVWPLDSDQREIIDSLKKVAVRREYVGVAADKLLTLHFDAFSAFIDVFIRNFSTEARLLISTAAERSNDSAFIFNAIEILREFEDFDLTTETKLAENCDEETLYEMYHSLVEDALGSFNRFIEQLPKRIYNIDDNLDIENVTINELRFKGGSGVSFTAQIELDVRGWSSDPNKEPYGAESFNCTVDGDISRYGASIDKIV
ncbi:hypothetical protein MBRA_06278 [Methylobacterium brachiatum]|nr:hypothetical protein MBRA_06278 [Methylobacterium brachiatum]